MAKRGKDNDHTKSGQLRRRGQYRIQHVMMMIKTLAYKRRNITVKLLSASGKILFSLFYSLEVQAERTDSGFRKNFCGRYLLYFLNISATAAPK